MAQADEQSTSLRTSRGSPASENLQREDLSPKEEAEALEVLVRERGWTTRQIGQAIKHSHIYVSRRLRVFEDDALVGSALAGRLAREVA